MVRGAFLDYLPVRNIVFINIFLGVVFFFFPETVGDWTPFYIIYHYGFGVVLRGIYLTHTFFTMYVHIVYSANTH